MTHSESVKELAVALTKAQGEFEAVSKDATNPFFKSRYATLDNIIDTLRPTLSKHGLAIIQGNEPTENGVTITTMLVHTSGEWVMSSLSMPVVKADPQG